MKPKENISTNESGPLEVVVGVFPTHLDASRVAASLRGPDLQIKKISRKDDAVPSHLPEIVFDDIDEIDARDVSKGVLAGGAIGVGTGLLLIGVPGLNVAAPVVGAIAGMWIGCIAGADEAVRGINQPGPDDYEKMLRDGKSFVVIAGAESTRMEYGARMIELGATTVYQHPPVMQTVRSIA